MTPPSPDPAPEQAPRPWTPTWSPDHTDPGLPPLTVITDPHDQSAYTTTALAAHHPAAGRIAVHPTPLATAPAYLAHDLIRALGKHLPPPDTTPPWWTTNADESWRVALAWTQALDVSHYVICRAHRITARHLEHLMALREHTRTRLTLVVSGPTPAALTAILKAAPHHHIDTLDSTRRHLADDLQMTPAPPDRYRWWQPAPFPAPHDEPWYELPPRPRQPAPPARGTPHARPTTADRVLPTTTPLPALADPGYPAAGHEPVAQRIHTRIAHPLHAAAVAARVLTGYDTGQLSQVTIPTPQRPRADLPPPLPPWALPLQDAARIYCELQGHIRPDLPAHLTGADRPFRLAPWDENDVEQATHTCGLIPAPTRQRSSRKSRS